MPHVLWVWRIDRLHEGRDSATDEVPTLSRHWQAPDAAVRGPVREPSERRLCTTGCGRNCSLTKRKSRLPLQLSLIKATL